MSWAALNTMRSRGPYRPAADGPGSRSRGCVSRPETAMPTSHRPPRHRPRDPGNPIDGHDTAPSATATYTERPAVR
ncbi:hypothetical protein Sm713_04730 [Streptomyces sp. TS71-3]|nr:hypothetical protein Sm713_04730 [Streptomyces sp. TS71-3]